MKNHLIFDNSFGTKWITVIFCKCLNVVSTEKISYLNRGYLPLWCCCMNPVLRKIQPFFICSYDRVNFNIFVKYIYPDILTMVINFAIKNLGHYINNFQQKISNLRCHQFTIFQTYGQYVLKPKEQTLAKCIAIYT